MPQIERRRLVKDWAQNVQPVIVGQTPGFDGRERLDAQRRDFGVFSATVARLQQLDAGLVPFRQERGGRIATPEELMEIRARGRAALVLAEEALKRATEVRGESVITEIRGDNGGDHLGAGFSSVNY